MDLLTHGQKPPGKLSLARNKRQEKLCKAARAVEDWGGGVGSEGAVGRTQLLCSARLQAADDPDLDWTEMRP